MKDSKTLAFINAYGILGSIEELCRLSPEAKKLVPEKPIAVSFVVKDGPSLTLRFENGVCKVEEGGGQCDIKLPLSTCEKFNGMIDGTVTPFPSKGFTKLRFLTQNFTSLTKNLESYLRATPVDLQKNEFFEASTVIMFNLIAQAVSQIGNNDRIGRFSASNIVDGTILLSIGGTIQRAIVVKDHHLSTCREIPAHYHAIMEFADLRLARDVFDGKVSTLGCIGNGLINMRGNLSMLDNINRILDRVALYLA
ncbi:MAG: hypothetical protein LBH42_03660 [Treponema sp.]|jgi:hypothetical protein|nr:hypothetical protein [Treponema sp.]